MEKYTNKYKKECYRGVTSDTPLDAMEFTIVPMDWAEDETQWALYTNLGSLTILDRMTGFGYRDIESGYRSPDGKFWLASGGCDVRNSGAVTMQEAIDWVKEHANTCVQYQPSGNGMSDSITDQVLEAFELKCRECDSTAIEISLEYPTDSRLISMSVGYSDLLRIACLVCGNKAVIGAKTPGE